MSANDQYTEVLQLNNAKLRGATEEEVNELTIKWKY
jgi:hypothetical protein